jgi:hypothetical protein
VAPRAALSGIGMLADTGSGGNVAETTSPATVTTDKTDYQPGDTVTITGTGWAPGEKINMLLHADPTTHEDINLSSVADENGNFANTDYVVQDSDLGVTFLLTATGETSALTAQTTFTDAGTDTTTSVDAAPVSPQTYGTSITFTATITAKGGNDGPTGTVEFNDGSASLGSFPATRCLKPQLQALRPRR